MKGSLSRGSLGHYTFLLKETVLDLIFDMNNWNVQANKVFESNMFKTDNMTIRSTKDLAK